MVPPHLLYHQRGARKQTTMTDASDFVSNGSLIGYNAYATAIKADFERAAQAFFLVNKKFLAKTMFTPIILD